MGNGSVGKPDDLSQLEWPPGFAGQLAQAVHRGSFSQIKELSIATSLAVLHGALGRAIQTPTYLDCAAYFISTAASGTGKDALHKGSRAVFEAAEVKGALDRFLWQAKPMSAEALQAKVLTTPGLILVHREFGKRLKRMAKDNDPNERKFLEQLTDLFENSYASEKTHANSKNTLPGRALPALSFIGDSTTTAYDRALTSEMMEDGFLSRFTRIHYDGDIKEPELDAKIRLPEEVQKTWRFILQWAHWHETQTAKILNEYEQEIVIPIDLPPEVIDWSPAEDNAAFNLWMKFAEECRAQANSTKDDRWRFMFTRAPSKVLKTATVLSYANCAHERVLPELRFSELMWTEQLVRRDNNLMIAKLRQGDVGSDDAGRLDKLSSIFIDAIRNGVAPSYRVDPGLLENRIVPYSYLLIRVSQLHNFQTYQGGQVKALTDTLRALSDAGVIAEIDRKELKEKRAYHGRAYGYLK